MHQHPYMTHRSREALFGNRTQRSGYGPVPSNDDRNAEQTRNLFEEQNNKELSALHNQVSSLKQLTLDINTEIVSQNQFLDGMSSDFDSTGNLLGNTLKKMNMMLQSGGGKHMLYLAMFVVFVFVLIYWTMKPK